MVPVMNAGPFLERALRSVLDQAGDDTEVLVVDGGSTDGGVEVIHRHADRLAWWCSEPDAGQSEALNKGFARATGEYLLWLNADDLLLPGALANLAARIRQSPTRPQWLVGNMMIIDARDRIRRCLRDGAWHDFLYRHAPVRVYGPGAVFRRELFEAVGGFDPTLTYCMDTDLWLRFQRAGARYVRIDRYLWGFRQHAASKTNSGAASMEAAQAAERARMHAKNGLQIRSWNVLANRTFRLLGGAYLRAGIDTLRYRGRPV
ncbi:MAG: glycosyltransferase family 2 protein [Kiritimatiellae bacterium]|nr:glycosyltransferase family 2 protein [Kiritimatiellia bacterium]